MIQNNDIEKNAVRVNRGSGLIVSMANRYFVVTALHCLDGNLEQSILSYDKKKNYIVKESYFHENREVDIVLLEIDYLVDDLLEITFAKNSDISSEDKIKAYGFPSKRKIGEPMLGKVSQWNSVATTIQTELSYLGSNIDDEEAINNISGWSGSGVFKKNLDGTLSLIGVLSSLTDSEHTYQTINCISIETIIEVVEYNQLDKISGIEIKKHRISIGDKFIEVETVDVEVDGKMLGVSVFPVSYAEYDLFCGETNNEKINTYIKDNRDKYPVVKITLDKAVEYCKWFSQKSDKNYRLPTSSEWASIALQNMPKENLDNYIWHKDNSDGEVQAIGTKQSGIKGIYDLYGNVEEICSDRVTKGCSYSCSLKNILNIEKSRKIFPNKKIGFRILRDNILSKIN